MEWYITLILILLGIMIVIIIISFIIWSFIPATAPIIALGYHLSTIILTRKYYLTVDNTKLVLTETKPASGFTTSNSILTLMSNTSTRFYPTGFMMTIVNDGNSPVQLSSEGNNFYITSDDCNTYAENTIGTKNLFLLKPSGMSCDTNEAMSMVNLVIVVFSKEFI